MGTVVDVILREIHVVENGEHPKGKQAANLLTVNTFPEEMAKVPAVKSLRLVDGQTIDFTKEDHVSGKNFTKEEIFLLRRELVAPTDLLLSLATVDSVSRVEKLLAKFFKAAFKGAWSALSAGIGNVLVASGASTVVGFHLDSLDAKDEVFVIGEGELELDPAKLPTKPVKVPLYVKKAVDRRAPSVAWGHTGAEKNLVRVLEPDASKPNGHVILEIKAYAPI